MVYTDYDYEWDPWKAVTNWLKHGISFQQAITAFDDPERFIAADTKHSSAAEIREWLLGESVAGLLVVVFTVRIGNVFRIISARKANRKERRIYVQALRKKELGRRGF